MLRGTCFPLLIISCLGFSLQACPDPSEFPPDASETGQEIRVNRFLTSAQTMPALAMDNAGDFVVTWLSQGQTAARNALGQRYNSQGTPLGSEFMISHLVKPEAQATDLDVAIDNAGHFVASWAVMTSGDPHQSRIYAQRYHAHGQTLGGIFEVSLKEGDYQIKPSLAMNDTGQFAIVWQRFELENKKRNYHLILQRYHPDGNPIAPPLYLVPKRTQSSQVDANLALNQDGDIVVTWVDIEDKGPMTEHEIWAQQLTAAGEPEGAAFQVDTASEAVKGAPEIGMDQAGNFIIAWGDYSQENGRTYARRYDASGEALGPPLELPHPDAFYHPQLAMNAAGQFVVSRLGTLPQRSDTDVFVRRFAPEGTPLGNETRVNMHTKTSKSDNAVALDSSGNIVVAWASYAQESETQDDIYARHYTKNAGN